MRKLLLTALLAGVAGPLLASEGDELTSLSYISYLERYATVQPATQQDSIEAVINMPLAPGDRIDTAREARMEVMLADGNAVWIDEYTTLSLDAVAFSRDVNAEQTVLFLGEGTIVVEVGPHRLTNQPVRIDGRSATVYLNDTGLYRVEALPSEGLRVEVWEGLAEASTIAGGVLVRAQSATLVSGGEVVGSESVLNIGDDFASWVEQRRQVIRGESAVHVDARYDRQAAQLDNYGNWVYVSEYNTWAWQPTVDDSWRPYTAGRWYWTEPGWSWISYEPWGWLPYHYGSWYFAAGFGWVWGWQPYWSPAWVSWCWWPGYVGWAPCGYYWGWYWPSYGYYYGYPYDPYPGHPGGGGGQPPRRDAIPRPGSGGEGGSARDVHRAAITRPNEVALDLKGRARVAGIDRAGWNVISTRDFASPHLSRLVQPGESALRGQDAMGVVMSDALATAPPSMARPSAELERVFRDVERGTTRDITPVMARDASLRGEDALRLVEPTTLEAVTRRSAGSRSTTVRTNAPRETAAGSTAARGTAAPRAAETATDRRVLTTSPSSPLHGGSGQPAAGTARPSTGGGTNSRVHSGSVASNPFVPRSRPASAGSPSGAQAASPYLRGGSLARQPVDLGSRYRAPSSRVMPGPAGGGGSQSPVIVPRSAPSRTGPTVSSSRPAPRNPTASVRGSSSAPRSAGSGATSRSHAGSSGGGATSSRPSSGSHRR